MSVVATGAAARGAVRRASDHLMEGASSPFQEGVGVMSAPGRTPATLRIPCSTHFVFSHHRLEVDSAWRGLAGRRRSSRARFLDDLYNAGWSHTAGSITNMFSLVAGLAVLACAHLADSQLVSPSQLASQNSLTASNTLPFPTAALSSTNDTQSFIVKNWSLSKGRIQNNPEDLTFVDDPFPNSPAPGSQASSGPVLQVTYPKGSYSHGTGGTQLYSLWNTTDGSQWNSMIVSYDVAFDAGFDWVKGGKLPGVRGGPNVDGCSGGDASDGTNCFSSRVMWRKNGAGEGMYRLLMRHIHSDKDIVLSIRLHTV